MTKLQSGIHLATTCFLLALAGIVQPTAAQAGAYPSLADQPGAKADHNAPWYKACMKVKDLQPPKEEQPSAASLAALGDCDAVDLYYDTLDKPGATAADWARVHQCAVSRGDSAVLTMLYANGQGVKFNPDLALHYACSGNGMAIATRDLAEDMMDLQVSRQAPKPPYDICDNAVAARARILCGQIDEEEKDNADARKLTALSAHWPAAQQQALAALRTAAMGFADALGEESDEAALADQGETPDSVGEERRRQKALFIQDIGDTEKGILPHYTHSQYDGLDKELGEAYLESDTPQSEADPSTVALRKTQHAWLAYRDAWVAFGKLRHPKVPAYAWKAMLTERRLEQLEADDSN